MYIRVFMLRRKFMLIPTNNFQLMSTLKIEPIFEKYIRLYDNEIDYLVYIEIC